MIQTAFIFGCGSLSGHYVHSPINHSIAQQFACNQNDGAMQSIEPEPACGKGEGIADNRQPCKQ